MEHPSVFGIVINQNQKSPSRDRGGWCFYLSKSPTSFGITTGTSDGITFGLKAVGWCATIHVRSCSRIKTVVGTYQCFIIIDGYLESILDQPQKMMAVWMCLLLLMTLPFPEHHYRETTMHDLVGVFRKRSTGVRNPVKKRKAFPISGPV